MSDQQEEIIERLRAQLQNCIDHLERARSREIGPNKGRYDKCIEQANEALYETLHRRVPCDHLWGWNGHAVFCVKCQVLQREIFNS